MKTLTKKQEKFCLNFVKLNNASEAAVLAGYSDRTAVVIASQNLTKLYIQERIKQLRQKAEDATIMDVIERKQRLSEIARASLPDFMELGQDGSWVNIGPETPGKAAIQEIHSRTEYDKDTAQPTVYTSVKLHDPIRAIQELNKMDKLYSDNVNINLNNNHTEAKVVVFNSADVAKAIIEAERLGLAPAVLGGNGHHEDTTILSASTDLQATPIPESEN